MNGQERIDERRRRQAGRRGFTLIELLVVILIILLVSAVVLPTVIPAISHRQVSEAARILQGALAGARDTAINNNAPAGIRLLPDPVLNGQSLNAPGDTACCRHSTRPGSWPPTGTSRSSSRRIIRRVRLASSYPRHLVAPFNARSPTPPYFPYPAQTGGGFYPAGTYRCSTSSSRSTTPQPTCSTRRPPGTGTSGLATRSSSTTRGIWYTIVGPMNIYNPELFVNVGDPGASASSS